MTMNDVEHQQFVMYNMEASGAEDFSAYYYPELGVSKTDEDIKDKLTAKIIQIFQDDVSEIEH